MTKLIPIENEKEVKAKLRSKATYKAKAAWFDDSPNGKSFVAECANFGCPIEMKSQGVLENGVQFIEVKIYFKTDSNQETTPSTEG